MKISNELIEATKKWLGQKGIDHFKEIKEKHGRIDAVYNIELEYGSIPHSVHFNEGMQIRNFMRSTELCKEWTAHDYDDNWVQLMEKVIEGA